MGTLQRQPHLKIAPLMQGQVDHRDVAALPLSPLTTIMRKKV